MESKMCQLFEQLWLASQILQWIINSSDLVARSRLNCELRPISMSICNTRIHSSRYMVCPSKQSAKPPKWVVWSDRAGDVIQTMDFPPNTNNIRSEKLKCKFIHYNWCTSFSLAFFRLSMYVQWSVCAIQRKVCTKICKLAQAKY